MDGLNRIHWYLHEEHTAGLLFIMLGINDFNHDVSMCDYLQRLHAIVECQHDVARQLVVLGLAPLTSHTEQVLEFADCLSLFHEASDMPDEYLWKGGIQQTAKGQEFLGNVVDNDPQWRRKNKLVHHTV